ncbi:hypothetical protein TWF730_003202 [Orbilia blumenaviensis]|uniref:Uncharacterized protein n=1 Tax=Orbilia blumenaviensis TaxID=1796055 RepID=A0AAV9U851_9PEZI
MKASFIVTLALAAAVTASPIASPVEQGNLEKRDTCPVGTVGYTNCARACYYRYTSPCSPPICQMIAEYIAKCNQCCIDKCNLC